MTHIVCVRTHPEELLVSRSASFSSVYYILFCERNYNEDSFERKIPIIQFNIYERTHPDSWKTFLNRLINNSKVTTLNDYSNAIRAFPFCRIQIWNAHFEFLAYTFKTRLMPYKLLARRTKEVSFCDFNILTYLCAHVFIDAKKRRIFHHRYLNPFSLGNILYKQANLMNFFRSAWKRFMH